MCVYKLIELKPCNCILKTNICMLHRNIEQQTKNMNRVAKRYRRTALNGYNISKFVICFILIHLIIYVSAVSVSCMCLRKTKQNKYIIVFSRHCLFMI